MHYLEKQPFAELGISVVPFHTPAVTPVWDFAREVSALWALASIGLSRLTEALHSVATELREAPRLYA